MLNSTEYEISTDHNNLNVKNNKDMYCFQTLREVFIMLINVKMLSIKKFNNNGTSGVASLSPQTISIEC